MLLAAFLLIGAPLSASAQEAPTRADILSSFRQVLAAFDTDRDGTLSLVEWAGRIRGPSPARSRRGEGFPTDSEFREFLIDQHSGMDEDRDGKVTFDELVREPLATFDCADGDRDLRLSPAEIQSARKRCQPGPAVRIGFISEPPAADPQPQ